MLYFRLISKLLINGCHDVYTQRLSKVNMDLFSGWWRPFNDVNSFAAGSGGLDGISSRWGGSLCSS